MGTEPQATLGPGVRFPSQVFDSRLECSRWAWTIKPWCSILFPECSIFVPSVRFPSQVFDSRLECLRWAWTIKPWCSILFPECSIFVPCVRFRSPSVRFPSRVFVSSEEPGASSLRTLRHQGVSTDSQSRPPNLQPHP